LHHPARPTTSAIIVTHNRLECLERAIESVLAQDPAPLEIIVVDDGSSDGTADHLRSRFRDRIRLIEQPHSGVSVARRTGVSHATGDWIAFLDSDDQWLPGRMALMEQVALAMPDDVHWIFGDSRFEYLDSADTVFAETGWRPADDVEILERPLAAIYPHMVGLLPSSLVRRDALVRAGCFAENLTTGEDLLVGFRIALNGRFACVRDIVTTVDRKGREDSLFHRTYHSSDYFRARVLSFDEAAAKLGPADWKDLYTSNVRAWCIALARQGERCHREALLQFKHAAGARELLFTLCAALGTPPVKLWGSLRGLRQAYEVEFPASAQNGISSSRSAEKLSRGPEPWARPPAGWKPDEAP
jgi:glycosyltransferase involved in cell wall biosynthesis